MKRGDGSRERDSREGWERVEGRERGWKEGR